MEHIQKALEKAKKQREDPSFVKQKITTKQAQANPVRVEEISYSQTQTIAVSKEILKRNRVVAGLNDDPRADVFKILRTKILQRMRANDWNVLAVTSPTANAGKSLTAANLAISIAMDANYSVLLADLDLRRPGIHQYFDIAPEFGLKDYFEGDKGIADLLVHPGLESLVLLPAGKPIRGSSELLSTPKMMELANELKHRYPDRIVIVDLPPLLQTDDAMIFMPNVDACVLVVAEGENTKEDVQNSLRLIDEEKYLGSILNKSGEINPSTYTYY